MVLVDHDKLFSIRIKARFKAQGLENRLWFVPYRDLHDGSLHRFIGAVEVYVNNGGYSGLTALNDALWSANAVISWHSDYTLAGRIAADLHTAFGTPENLCRTAADATTAYFPAKWGVGRNPSFVSIKKTIHSFQITSIWFSEFDKHPFAKGFRSTK